MDQDPGKRRNEERCRLGLYRPSDGKLGKGHDQARRDCLCENAEQGRELPDARRTDTAARSVKSTGAALDSYRVEPLILEGLMNIEKLKKEYDFTESRVTGISWSRMFRDLRIRVDYYWDRANDLAPKPGPSQPMLICLRNCIWVQFWSDPEYCHAAETVARDAFTIIGWDILDAAAKMKELSLESDREFFHVFFQSWHNKSGKSWIEVICDNIEIVARKPGER